MRHVATTLAMAGWSGFFGVWSVRLAEAAGLPLLPDRIAPAIAAAFGAWPVPALPGHEKIAFAAVFAALAIGAGASVEALAERGTGRERYPEVKVAVLLCAAAAFYLSALVAGSPLSACFGEGPAFLGCLAASFAILLFDRIVEVEDDVAGDAAFRAALDALRKAEIEATRARWLDEERHRRNGRR